MSPHFLGHASFSHNSWKNCYKSTFCMIDMNLFVVSGFCAASPVVCISHRFKSKFSYHVLQHHVLMTILHSYYGNQLLPWSCGNDVEAVFIDPEANKGENCNEIPLSEGDGCCSNGTQCPRLLWEFFITKYLNYQFHAVNLASCFTGTEPEASFYIIRPCIIPLKVDSRKGWFWNLQF